MARSKPNSAPVRRSSRLKKIGQNCRDVEKSQTVRADLKPDDKQLQRVRNDVRNSAKMKNNTVVRTRIKGIAAEKKVNSRLSSSDSCMSGTAMVVPKPKAPRASHVKRKYRNESFPKPPCAESPSSSSSDSRPYVGPSKVTQPPNAVQPKPSTPGKKGATRLAAGRRSAS